MVPGFWQLAIAFLVFIVLASNCAFAESRCDSDSFCFKRVERSDGSLRGYSDPDSGSPRRESFAQRGYRERAKQFDVEKVWRENKLLSDNGEESFAHDASPLNYRDNNGRQATSERRVQSVRSELRRESDNYRESRMAGRRTGEDSREGFDSQRGTFNGRFEDRRAAFNSNDRRRENRGRRDLEEREARLVESRDRTFNEDRRTARIVRTEKEDRLSDRRQLESRQRNIIRHEATERLVSRKDVQRDHDIASEVRNRLEQRIHRQETRIDKQFKPEIREQQLRSRREVLLAQQRRDHRLEGSKFDSRREERLDSQFDKRSQQQNNVNPRREDRSQSRLDARLESRRETRLESRRETRSSYNSDKQLNLHRAEKFMPERRDNQMKTRREKREVRERRENQLDSRRRDRMQTLRRENQLESRRGARLETRREERSMPNSEDRFESRREDIFEPRQTANQLEARREELSDSRRENQYRLESRRDEHFESRRGERFESRREERLPSRREERFVSRSDNQSNLKSRSEEHLPSRREERTELRESQLESRREGNSEPKRHDGRLELRMNERLEARRQERLELRFESRRQQRSESRREHRSNLQQVKVESLRMIPTQRNLRQNRDRSESSERLLMDRDQSANDNRANARELADSENRLDSRGALNSRREIDIRRESRERIEGTIQGRINNLVERSEITSHERLLVRRERDTAERNTLRLDASENRRELRESHEQRKNPAERVRREVVGRRELTCESRREASDRRESHERTQMARGNNDLQYSRRDQMDLTREMNSRGIDSRREAGRFEGIPDQIDSRRVTDRKDSQARQTDDRQAIAQKPVRHLLERRADSSKEEADSRSYSVSFDVNNNEIYKKPLLAADSKANYMLQAVLLGGILLIMMKRDDPDNEKKQRNNWILNNLAAFRLVF